MPLPSTQNLVRLSRDRNALLKAAICLAGISLILAFVVSWVVPISRIVREPLEPAPPRSIPELVSLIRFGMALESGKSGRSCADLAKDEIRILFAESAEASLEDFASDPASASTRIWWQGLTTEDPSDAIRRLEANDAKARHHHEFLGDLRYRSRDTAGALRDYLAEAERFEDAAYARRSALYLARYEEDTELLRRLLADESYRAVTNAGDLLVYQAGARDYVGMARSVIFLERDLLRSPFVIPALFTAAIWFFILLSFRSHDQTFLGLALAAFALGIVSALLTVYAVMIQENVRGFRSGPEDPAMKQFIYFLAGVALREESLKLLCFLPLAIGLRKRATALEILVLAGMVGLGFAFQENLAYFRNGSGSFTAWLRLLTANPLHFSLTGVAGFALWRMIARRFRGWEEFLITFLAVVFVHALYNSLLAIPAMADYAPLSPILVALIAYQYFDPLRQNLELAGLHRRLSPLGIFVIGSALLTCAILVSSTTVMPFRIAVGLFASSVGSMIPLAFAFISRFRDL